MFRSHLRNHLWLGVSVFPVFSRSSSTPPPTPPARPELLAALAAFGGEGEDREFILEDELDEGEEDDDPREPDHDDEQIEDYWLELDGYRAVLLLQHDNKLWKGEPVS